jgi:small GTP-binding protein
VTIGAEFASFALRLKTRAHSAVSTDDTLEQPNPASAASGQEQVDNIKLQIWDTAGQETFRSMIRVFYKGAHCGFLVYDISRQDTFHKVEEWLEELRQNAGPEIPIVLVGNQKDLDAEREVSVKEAQEFATREGLDWFVETSAKTGEGVEQLFVRTAIYLYQNATELTSGNIHLDDDEIITHKKKCKC